MVIHYKPTGKNSWDIRIGGGKKGRIEKRRGSFVAVMTRSVEPAALDVISGFVADLNG